jgi:hypothetical protein
MTKMTKMAKMAKMTKMTKMKIKIYVLILKKEVAHIFILEKIYV